VYVPGVHDVSDSLVNDVRVHVYDSFVARGRPPMPLETSAALGVAEAEVTAALRRLHDDDVIALMPGTSFVWLAHPFSALTAPFEVISDDRRWDAICIWDALGVLAVVERDGRVRTLCPDCAEPLELEVRDGEIEASDYVVHFGVPAARWYEDLAYT
jgi:alkylmercury lyase